MQKISDFLERFSKLARSSDDAKEAVIAALTQSGIKYMKGIETITIKGAVAMLKITPAQKSEIFLKQKKILAELSKNPLTKHITVVR